MKKSRMWATGLSLFFLTLMLSALAARFWLSDRAYEFTGPTQIAAGPEHVYVFAAGDIYQLSHAGELLGVAPPGVTGIKDDPIDLKVLPDGRLLIAEQRPAVIRICEVDSWNCHAAGAAPGSLIERQFKVLADNSGNELLLTDARGDTLWKMDSAGGEPQELLPRGTLAGPNDLAYGDGGSVWVADTDHRRIIELLPSPEGGFLPGREHSAINPLTVGERFFPVMLARSTDGRWWVTQSADFSKPYADLVVYDPQDGVQARIDLPPGAYPTDVVALLDSVLVTDLERFTVYRVQPDSMQASEFGDEHFRQRLAQLGERRAYYNRLGAWSLAAIILFAILLISAAVLATPKERRWTQTPAPFDLSTAPGEVPVTKGVHWLERDPKVDQALKWLEHLGLVLFLLLLAGGLGLYVWVRILAGPDPNAELTKQLWQLGMILLLGGLAGALMIPVVHYSVRAMRRKIGTDGQRLFIRLPDGRELSAAPSQLAYTDRAVLYRQYTLPLMAGKHQSLYLHGEIQTWLAPLLRQSRRLTAMQTLKYQWKNR